MARDYLIILIAVIIASLISIGSAWYLVKETKAEFNEHMAVMMGGTAQKHEESKAYPIKTSRDRVLEAPYALKDGVKEFHLTAEPIRWEYAQGKYVDAWGYNGQVPGPEIRVTEGDSIRVVLTNNLPKPTTIHWHGINVPYQMDGVPSVSQEPIPPGERFIYDFNATPAGTRFYHTHGSSHSDEAQQLDMGLSGAFIIEPKEENKKSTTYDREYTLVLDEWEITKEGENAAATMNHLMSHSMNYNVFTINGKAYPDTEPLLVKEGEKMLIRLINAGSSVTHPMHLHGHSFKIVAIDGNAVPEAAQLIRDTLPIAPGERYDIEVIANNPGIWVFHCHELHHADGGMIVPLAYEGVIGSTMQEGHQ